MSYWNLHQKIYWYMQYDVWQVSTGELDNTMRCERWCIPRLLLSWVLFTWNFGELLVHIILQGVAKLALHISIFTSITLPLKIFIWHKPRKQVTVTPKTNWKHCGIFHIKKVVRDTIAWWYCQATLDTLWCWLHPSINTSPLTGSNKCFDSCKTMLEMQPIFTSYHYYGWSVAGEGMRKILLLLGVINPPTTTWRFYYMPVRTSSSDNVMMATSLNNDQDLLDAGPQKYIH